MGTRARDYNALLSVTVSVSVTLSDFQLSRNHLVSIDSTLPRRVKDRHISQYTFFNRCRISYTGLIKALLELIAIRIWRNINTSEHRLIRSAGYVYYLDESYPKPPNVSCQSIA